MGTSSKTDRSDCQTFRLVLKEGPFFFKVTEIATNLSAFAVAFGLYHAFESEERQGEDAGGDEGDGCILKGFGNSGQKYALSYTRE